MFACFHSRLSAVPRLAPVQASKQPRKSARGRGWWLGQRRCGKACRQPATCVRGACAASGLRVPGQWWPRRTFLSYAPTSIISDCFCMHLRLEDEHVERLLRVVVHAAGELAVARVVCLRGGAWVSGAAAVSAAHLSAGAPSQREKRCFFALMRSWLVARLVYRSNELFIVPMIGYKK